MSIPPVSFQRLLAAALMSAALAGCGREASSRSTKEIAAAAPDSVEVKGKVVSAAKTAPEGINRLRQPFRDAVLRGEPPASDELLLDVTCAGKNVAKLYEAVAGKDDQGGLWDKVVLVDPQGKVLKYRATLQTKLGEIDIDLYPEAAPNHVRNFIALARAGYYDGLPIYRSVRDSMNDMVLNAFIEAGCPKGTGEIGYGSIGYWLKPEIEGNKLTHEEGAVGACRREELETASCRFYITAEKMPQMDGEYTVFGKVTRGLDIVRRINAAAVEDKTSYRLKEPVALEKVTIQAVGE
jgi:peptidyl-prolyl cis-trans isomerase B (cyclophilin B)